MEIRIAGIVKESVVDGPGIRLVVFAQGCPHHCPGCQNPETHDPAGGKTEQTETILALFEQNPLLRGLTLSGGEPLEQTEACLVLAKGTTEKGKDVILYTGYTWEQLVEKQKSDPILAELLSYVWLVIEGPFVLKLKNLALPFRGSSNQRIVDVAKSLPNGQIFTYRIGR